MTTDEVKVETNALCTSVAAAYLSIKENVFVRFGFILLEFRFVSTFLLGQLNKQTNSPENMKAKGTKFNQNSVFLLGILRNEEGLIGVILREIHLQSKTEAEFQGCHLESFEMKHHKANTN